MRVERTASDSKWSPLRYSIWPKRLYKRRNSEVRRPFVNEPASPGRSLPRRSALGGPEKADPLAVSTPARRKNQESKGSGLILRLAVPAAAEGALQRPGGGGPGLPTIATVGAAAIHAAAQGAEFHVGLRRCHMSQPIAASFYRAVAVPRRTLLLVDHRQRAPRSAIHSGNQPGA